MSALPPPPPTEAYAAAARKVARAAGVAMASAWTMLVLGGLSLALSIRAPWSASAAISLAICINGWIERREARALKAFVPTAPLRLAINQIAIGLEIAAYAVWQARTLGPEELDALLARPLIAGLLERLPREVVAEMVTLLPGVIDTLYLIVGAGAFIGCVITAWYYRTCLPALRLLSATPASTAPV